MSERYKFKGVITGRRWYSDSSNWGVFEFKTEQKIKTDEKYGTLFEEDFFKNNLFNGTLVGKVQELSIGEEYEIEAEVVYNKKYKKYDLAPIIVSQTIPTTYDEQERFLKTLITPRQANILLEAYPNIVDDVMNGVEVDLSKTRGIKQTSFNKIKTKIVDNYVIIDLLAMLSPYGITFNQIKKIADSEVNPAIIKQKILKNPYLLTEIHGLGFKKVDGIALKLNKDLLISEFRTKEYIKYTLSEIASGDGHTWIKRSLLISKARKDIKECMDILKNMLENELENPDFLKIQNDRIGLLKYYNQEKSIINTLKKIDLSDSIFPKIPKEHIEKIILETEEKQGFKYSDEQRDAIFQLCKDGNVMVISGNAGSGKTTVVNGIVNVLSSISIREGVQEFASYVERTPNIAQCALSAKASKRMSEVTGRPSSTIHRLLEFDPKFGFKRGEAVPLIQDVIIADELSMNNISICKSLFDAVKKGAKLILVFDFAQLPAIGAGSVAYDLLECSDFTKFKFTQVHRQAQKSGILMDANKVRVQDNPIKKLTPKVISGELKDMTYLFKNKKEDINKLAIKYFLDGVKKYGIDNISIICPRKDKVLNSAYEINKVIQDKLIPKVEGEYVQTDNKFHHFRLNDRVIQKVNDYDRGVINGDMGVVEKIDWETDVNSGKTLEIMYVNFGKDSILNDSSPDRIIKYTKEDLPQLRLSYAMTVHSYQGSQNKAIIIVMDDSHKIMLDSTILYTAMTRAEEKCLAITTPSAFHKCITTNKTIIRNTYMKELLKEDYIE